MTSVFRDGGGVGVGLSIFGSGGAPTPSFTLDATTGALPASATFTRASGATIVNSRGYIEEVAVNAPRFTYDPALVYNGYIDPWFDLCTVGLTPPNHVVFAGGGATWTNTVVDKGTTSDGLPYVTIRGLGTLTSTNGVAFVAGGTGAGTLAYTISGQGAQA